MYFHAQNLNELSTPDGEPQRYGSILRHGRSWWRWRAGFGGRGVNLDWILFSLRKSAHIDLTFGDGDAGRDLAFSVAIPFVLSLFITIENAFSHRLFAYDFDRGEDRRIGLSFHNGAMWWDIWVGTMASYGRRFPWCKWWRHGSLHFDDLLLGKTKMTSETLYTTTVDIPMPEGTYRGVASVERCTWKRPRWFAHVATTVDIKIPRGIPHAGKGENSWDSGDDGIYGISYTESSVERAVSHLVDKVIKNRRKYGEPSAKAIEAAIIDLSNPKKK